MKGICFAENIHLAKELWFPALKPFSYFSFALGKVWKHWSGKKYGARSLESWI